MGTSQESTRHVGRLFGQGSAVARAFGQFLHVVGFGRLGVALALLLFAAAALKLYDLLAPGSSNQQPELTVAVVFLEGALATGVLLLPPRAAWRLGLLTFAAFAAVASYKERTRNNFHFWEPVEGC